MINLNNIYYVLSSNAKIDKKTFREILSNSYKNILFFYPKDDTPWCSLENKDFTFYKQEFNNIWYNIIGVSKDSIDSHKKFIEKFDLKIDLISDPDFVLHKEFWAYWEKNNYWKIVNWVIRSTFILDKDWVLLKEYKNIRAKWHVEKLLKELKKLYINNII